ncbi:hypothetical protein [Phaeobacter sp. B1627]|uniref:hypothetical protein n=1 Tax=Phaeobacter sp. B1627 TaxID=2583809 RepID=UPI001117D6F9|nr:hypothetical protein [Phaeobacter sp. B1627]TNJ45115.1 hypothetical protein FGE21_06875 [Phaeobacter sp. B1627]
MPNFIILTSCFATLLLAPLLALLSAPAAVPGEPALVVSPPWKRAIDIVVSSDVPELATASSPLGALVVIPDARAIGRLFENGAWFVVDGKRIAQLCAL